MKLARSPSPDQDGDAQALPPNDFNDMAQAGGREVVRAHFAKALHDVESAPKGPHFRVDDKGVWYVGVTADGELSEPAWICSTLHVLAKTRDAQSEQWGRLLEWRDADGHAHRWAAPAAMLVGDGRDFARELASGGVEVAPGANALKRLLAYVMTQKSDQRARCVLAPGWHGHQYVLPTGEALGDTTEAIVYQHTGGVALHYGTNGDWRTNVAPACVGNARLLLAVSAMFAGPLLRLAGIDGGGFHFVGTSSTGKSTLLRVAASVAGSPRYAREWRVTANGLEGVAVLHNDATLILDELAQIDANQASEAVYLLANGTGKSRANRSGDSRATAQWLVQTLSAGEVGLAQHIAQVGKQARAGQAVRLAEVPADAGNGLGVFDRLHDAASGQAFSVALVSRSAEHYGTAWRPWLDWLATQIPLGIGSRIKREIADFQKRFVPALADGQVSRVAARFALAAVAGELATEAGLTGWPAGEAQRGAAAGLEAWIERRGGSGNSEKGALLAQVQAFCEAHGEGRFQDLQREHERPPINRVGFTRTDFSGNLEYLVLAEAFKRELCKGFDSTQAARWLREAQWLVPSSDGRLSQKPRIKGIGVLRVYVLSAAAVHGFEESTVDDGSGFAKGATDT